MDDSRTVLPDFLLAGLYSHSLVIAEETSAEQKGTPLKEKPASARQWYLGSNLRKITLLVDEKNAVYLEEASLQFLSSILGACKLNLGDVAIVNISNEPVHYQRLAEALEPACMILFGIASSAVQLPFSVPHYQVQKYDGRQFLLAPPLTAMLGDSQEAKLEKSKLWLSLKKMFNI